MANINERKRYHFTYKTTHVKTGKYYFGMHSTSNLDDGYIGSGFRLRRSVRKYGKENFKCEILEYFNSREELVEAEIKLVTSELLKDPKCLNLRPGGRGGFISVEQQRHRASCAGKALHLKRKTDPEFNRRFIFLQTEGRKRAIANGVKFHKIRYSWLGKKHKPETVEKMKRSKRGYGVGQNNSQYGSCWITDGVNNKKIKKTELIPLGWKTGRVLKVK